jgi:hypothetical protein
LRVAARLFEPEMRSKWPLPVKAGTRGCELMPCSIREDGARYCASTSES